MMENTDTIRNYRNTVIISFSKKGDNLSLKVPHYKKWLSIIKFLKGRGFEISENASYKEHYTVLSKYHKIGFKNNVALLMEIGSSRIEIEFGNIQNLWTGIAQSFWDDPSDKRYTTLNYLENTAIKLEIKKTIDFCMRWGLEMQEEDCNLSPEEYIIHTLNVNNHIHGKVECLDDIRKSIENGIGKYNGGSNSNDKNNKKIICGEIKYFYDYRTKRLSSGKAWHHINNMWWVISGKRRINICCRDLFDFNDQLQRRSQPDNYDFEKILKKYETIKDYQRCVQIQKHMQRVSLKVA